MSSVAERASLFAADQKNQRENSSPPRRDSVSASPRILVSPVREESSSTSAESSENSSEQSSEDSSSSPSSSSESSQHQSGDELNLKPPGSPRRVSVAARAALFSAKPAVGHSPTTAELPPAALSPIVATFHNDVEEQFKQLLRNDAAALSRTSSAPVGNHAATLNDLFGLWQTRTKKAASESGEPTSAQAATSPLNPTRKKGVTFGPTDVLEEVATNPRAYGSWRSALGASLRSFVDTELAPSSHQQSTRAALEGQVSELIGGLDGAIERATGRVNEARSRVESEAATAAAAPKTLEVPTSKANPSGTLKYSPQPILEPPMTVLRGRWRAVSQKSAARLAATEDAAPAAFINAIPHQLSNDGPVLACYRATAFNVGRARAPTLSMEAELEDSGGAVLILQGRSISFVRPSASGWYVVQSNLWEDIRGVASAIPQTADGTAGTAALSYWCRPVDPSASPNSYSFIALSLHGGWSLLDIAMRTIWELATVSQWPRARVAFMQEGAIALSDVRNGQGIPPLAVMMHNTELDALGMRYDPTVTGVAAGIVSLRGCKPYPATSNLEILASAYLAHGSPIVALDSVVFTCVNTDQGMTTRARRMSIGAAIEPTRVVVEVCDLRELVSLSVVESAAGVANLTMVSASWNPEKPQDAPSTNTLDVVLQSFGSATRFAEAIVQAWPKVILKVIELPPPPPVSDALFALPAALVSVSAQTDNVPSPEPERVEVLIPDPLVSAELSAVRTKLATSAADAERARVELVASNAAYGALRGKLSDLATLQAKNAALETESHRLAALAAAHGDQSETVARLTASVAAADSLRVKMALDHANRSEELIAKVEETRAAAISAASRRDDEVRSVLEGLVTVRAHEAKLRSALLEDLDQAYASDRLRERERVRMAAEREVLRQGALNRIVATASEAVDAHFTERLRLKAESEALQQELYSARMDLRHQDLETREREELLRSSIQQREVQGQLALERIRDRARLDSEAAQHDEFINVLKQQLTIEAQRGPQTTSDNKQPLRAATSSDNGNDATCAVPDPVLTSAPVNSVQTPASVPAETIPSTSSFVGSPATAKTLRSESLPHGFITACTPSGHTISIDSTDASLEKFGVSFGKNLEIMCQGPSGPIVLPFHVLGTRRDALWVRNADGHAVALQGISSHHDLIAAGILSGRDRSRNVDIQVSGNPVTSNRITVGSPSPSAQVSDVPSPQYEARYNEYFKHYRGPYNPRALPESPRSRCRQRKSDGPPVTSPAASADNHRSSPSRVPTTREALELLFRPLPAVDDDAVPWKPRQPVLPCSIYRASERRNDDVAGTGFRPTKSGHNYPSFMTL